MATLLQLGRRVINIDLVCEIEEYGDRLRLFYNVSSSDSAGMQQQAYADIEGRAADALRAWLSEHATQLLTTDEGGSDVGRRDNAASERARLLQAAVASDSNADETSTHDQGYYSTARLQQMHGVGSDTRANTSSEGDTPSDE